MLPADYYSVTPQHPHLPLIIMLVLTQLSVGAFTVGMIVENFLDLNTTTLMMPIHATGALLFGLLALGASTLHLGRPQYAYRALIGIRHSWLSREIVAFGLFAGMAVLYALSSWLSVGVFPEVTAQLPILEHGNRALGWGVTVTGGIGVFCSVMIYVFTKKIYWNFVSTGFKFLLTATILGIASFWAALTIVNFVTGSELTESMLGTVSPFLGQALIASSLMKLFFEASIFIRLTNRQNSPMKQSARLMIGPLSNPTLARFAVGIFGGVALPLVILGQQEPFLEPHLLLTGIEMVILFFALLAGELLERYLFFAAVSAPRMPGGIRS